MLSPLGRDVNGNRCEQQCCLWVMRLGCAGLLLLQPQKDPRAPPYCPSFDDFWAAVRVLAACYFLIDVGGCLLCACKPSWLRRVGCLGRPVSLVGVCLAVAGLVRYGKALSQHIRCVGTFGVVTLLFCFVFICSTLVWWAAIECDCFGLSDSPKAAASSWCALCRFCCELSPWTPAQDRARSPRSSSQRSPEKERLSFRVLAPSGALLFSSRSRLAVRRWVRKNLPRAKRAEVTLEERRRGRSRGRGGGSSSLSADAV
ncbi:unnamed protein product [Effrenium voratum]|uniref:Uncharacterized protein n=1 Tax=Effrenium voratum TaxID=2562239 RepID=A0AA36J7B4_9DINO|nr:unnamed protein product [Effrenium voratum]